MPQTNRDRALVEHLATKVMGCAALQPAAPPAEVRERVRWIDGIPVDGGYDIAAPPTDAPDRTEPDRGGPTYPREADCADPEPGPTGPMDIAREYFPGECDEALYDILVERTAFPFNNGDPEHLRGQLAWVSDGLSRCVDVDRSIWDEMCAAMDQVEARDAATK